MNKIKQEYVTFEQAKWLKEKEWNINTYSQCWVKTLDGKVIHNSERKDCIEHDRCEQYLMQPEQHQVVEWIRVKHGIWINIKSDCYGRQWNYTLDVCSKDVWDNLEVRSKIIASNHKPFIKAKSPQEATSEALDYIRLNNLI